MSKDSSSYINKSRWKVVLLKSWVSYGTFNKSWVLYISCQCVDVIADLWQEMGVAHPAKCQLLWPTRLPPRGRLLLKQTWKVYPWGKSPASNAHNALSYWLWYLSMNYAPGDVSAPGLRSGWRRGATTTAATTNHHQEKNTRSDKMPGQQGSIWLSLRQPFFCILRLRAGSRLSSVNTSRIWRCCVRPSFLLFELQFPQGRWANRS